MGKILVYALFHCLRSTNSLLAHVAMATIAETTDGQTKGRYNAPLKGLIESPSFNAISCSLGTYFSIIDSRRRLKARLDVDISRFLLSESHRTSLARYSFRPFLPIVTPVIWIAVFVDEWRGNRFRPAGTYVMEAFMSRDIAICCAIYVIFGIRGHRTISSITQM